MYEDELMKIDFYSLHPTLVPFIGNNYSKYRILQIGESHYISQTPENEKYNIVYFQKWWSDPCNEILVDSPEWVDTRKVLHNYMNEYRSGNSYTIFTNLLKSFSRVVLKKEISNITMEDKSLYNYIAFMNFFQMPSIYDGAKYWNALYASAKKCGNKKLASEQWNKAVQISTMVLDQVIDIIEPKAIVFTSISAGDAYKDINGKYSKDERTIYTSHPGYPYTWWKKLKSLDYQRGIDVFEEGLERIYNC